MKVLYLAGSGRCGSTLLGSALQEVDGFFSAGELVYLWERGLRRRHPCACGQPLTSCPVWEPVLKRAVGGDLDHAADRLARAQHDVARSRHQLLLRRASTRRRLQPTLDTYLLALRSLYTAIGEETGARVVVDGSKTPAYAEALRLVPGIELRVVHLVRDPRAVSWSWQRRRTLLADERGPEMSRYGIGASTALWWRYNAGAELLRRALPPSRSMRLRYEDFVAAPAEHLRSVVGFAGEPDPDLAFVSGASLRLGTNHAVSGNPSRFRSGDVAVRDDDEWRSAMPARDRTAVGLLSLPLSRRYGYR